MATVLSATIEPTERSIPPAIMTSVIPIAAMPTIVVWRAMVSTVSKLQSLCGEARK